MEQEQRRPSWLASLRNIRDHMSKVSSYVNTRNLDIEHMVYIPGWVMGDQFSFFSELMSKTKGRDKVSAFFQYVASLYINCMK